MVSHEDLMGNISSTEKVLKIFNSLMENIQVTFVLELYTQEYMDLRLMKPKLMNSQI